MALNNAQYATIMREYEEKRLQTRLLQDSRMNEIIRKIPEYKDLDNSSIDASMEYAKSALFDSPADKEKSTEKLRLHLSQIAEQKKRLLIKHGYPADYLDPVYTCPDCKDTGYIGTEKCHCFKQAIVDLLYTQSNIRDVLKKENFDNFNINYYSKTDIDPVTNLSAYDSMTGICNIAREFVADFPSSASNLLFLGKSGLGKTFLSHCIADELLKKGYTVLYLSAPQLFDILKKNNFGEKDEDVDYNELAHYVMNCDLLIIDDLGSEIVTELTASGFNICINERLLKKHSTLISTNLTPNELNDVYGERNFSRIVGFYRFCRFYGTDIRFAKKQ